MPASFSAFFVRRKNRGSGIFSLSRGPPLRPPPVLSPFAMCNICSNSAKLACFHQLGLRHRIRVFCTCVFNQLARLTCVFSPAFPGKLCIVSLLNLMVSTACVLARAARFPVTCLLSATSAQKIAASFQPSPEPPGQPDRQTSDLRAALWRPPIQFFASGSRFRLHS